MRLLPIAALQTSPVFGDPAATVRRMAEQVARVREVMPRVRLVMFPELHLAALPPVLNPQPTLKGSDPLRVDVPGPLTEELGEIARAGGVWLVPGSVYERGEGDRVHNTCLGLSICYHGSFPETCRRLPWMGAEVVLQVSLTTTSDRPQELVLAQANAIFNQLYVVSLWEQTVRSAPALGLQPTRDGERSG